jgi:hypothetical protein
MAALAILITIAVAAPAGAQAASPQPTPPPQADARVKVHLTCDVCDIAQLSSALAFVDVVVDREAADVEVVVTARPQPPQVQASITMTGRGRFDGQQRLIPLRVPATMPDAELRVEIERFVKLGLVEYAASSAQAAFLDVTFEPAGTGPASIQEDQEDPWNYWVFRLGSSAFLDGQSTTSSAYYSMSGSATRTTEQWKIRLSSSRSLSTSRFDFEDGESIESRLTDWSVDGLVVKSLGPHWSVGATGSVVGSTFSNSRRVVRLSPAIEYDLFPYAESSRRSLTFQYTIGGARYEYEAETIFDRLEESIAQHSVNVSLGLRQPWGQAGASLVFTQQLQAPERTRTTLNGSINVRLIRSLTLNTSASYSRVRDLFTLEKGEATDDEVLLRQRQLATGYRYSFSVGFGYAFGALSNTTVNPRFGG